MPAKLDQRAAASRDWLLSSIRLQQLARKSKIVHQSFRLHKER